MLIEREGGTEAAAVCNKSRSDVRWLFTVHCLQHERSMNTSK